jgi:ribonucleoside-diphosphate reductase beta chain
LIATYEHFLGLASRLQWDDATIDLSADATPDERVAELLAGFCVGEAAVAEHLHDFFDGPAAACFAAQRRDEERHARFFARYARSVGLDDPRAHISEQFIELFEQRLPEAAARAGSEAVGVYHMVLEGVVFTAGQLALLDILDDQRPGLRQGTELVLRDERWHVGFGTRCLLDAGLSASAETMILQEGARAAALWAPEQADRVMATLHRRLKAVR